MWGCVVFCLWQADVGLAATIGAMDAANAVAVEWGLGASTPGVLDEVRQIDDTTVNPFFLYTAVIANMIVICHPSCLLRRGTPTYHVYEPYFAVLYVLYLVHLVRSHFWYWYPILPSHTHVHTHLEQTEPAFVPASV